MEDNVLHSSASVTATVLTKKEPEAPRHPNDVDFEVKYPEGYKGPKYMPEGVVVVARETAEDYVKRGIGKIIQPAADGEKPEETVEEKTEETGDASDKPLAEMTKPELQKLLTEKGIEFKKSMKPEELIALLQPPADGE